jgi:hypothetical protein
VIYFIRHLETDLVKIGHSRDVRTRFGQICHAHGACEVLGTIEGGKSKESELHRLFARFHVKGVLQGREWFSCSIEILKYINEHTDKYLSEFATTSFMVDPDAMEQLTIFKDFYGLSTYSETITYIIRKAFPNVDEIVAINRRHEEARKSMLQDFFKDINNV